MHEARQTGKCDPCELELLRRDGSRLPVLMGTARIDEAGEHFVHFILDLSGRRAADEAQARLAAIVESSQDEIISKTLDGRIATWNAGAQRMFGYTAAEVVGLPSAFLAPPRALRRGRAAHCPPVCRRARGTGRDPNGSPRTAGDSTSP